MQHARLSIMTPRAYETPVLYNYIFSAHVCNINANFSLYVNEQRPEYFFMFRHVDGGKYIKKPIIYVIYRLGGRC
jgi:hypothetical protein